MHLLIAYTFLLYFLTSCSGPADAPVPDADDKLVRQWHLPGGLREISGLALTGDGRLLAVNDEEAIVYEIDYLEGVLVKRFAFGDPVLRGDFEGIAVTGETVWLMTSAGRLVATHEGADGEHLQYREFATALGDYCELEGMAADRMGGFLLLACKETYKGSDPLRVFRLELDGGEIGDISSVNVSASELARKIGHKRLRPSALAVDPESGNRVMLAANHRALLTVTADGDAIDAIILPGKGRHRQPEGIAITNDGHLLIADEGGDGRARLAVYRWTSGRLGRNNNNE